ncbi:hypothetical protein COU20_03540 [Candidatus Kaiserbacteria bacterium CG10_big_fil_rev_8_21_14_0_10_59_10]|uniref:Uncharacterized protein n=1 Tax=Candidatus Kaiserbacteria bacterium CG10_big_fil_rev_8_21_14_0_10_59_10 TaxID=1974612 RepID=A0A2H0U700_9BACT|nr:MAG: hypothetical protein COU20_03540 [Candidatus Kaiserbacteria bacterium CG10_big_fil_rev_8_21_14_0_10_59_10]
MAQQEEDEMLSSGINEEGVLIDWGHADFSKFPSASAEEIKRNSQKFFRAAFGDRVPRGTAARIQVTSCALEERRSCGRRLRVLQVASERSGGIWEFFRSIFGERVASPALTIYVRPSARDENGAYKGAKISFRIPDELAKWLTPERMRRAARELEPKRPPRTTIRQRKAIEAFAWS